MLGNFFYSYVSLSLFIVGLLSILPKSNSFSLLELYSRFYVVWFFILIFGLRTINSGADTEAYRLFFEEYIYGDAGEFTDFGFLLFADFVSFFTSDSKVFIISIFLVQLLLLFSSLKILRVSNISFFLITFVFLMPGFDMISNTIRQGLSVSFVFLALSLYLRNLTKTSLFIILVAFSIHVSSAVYFLLFFLSSKFWIKVHKILLMIILIVFFMSNFFNASVAEFLHSLGVPGVVGLVINKLYNYEAYNDGRLTGIYKLYFFLIYYVPVLIFLFHKEAKQKIIENKHVNAVITFYLIVLFIYALISKGTFSFRLLYVIYPVLIYILIQLYLLKGQYYRFAFYCFVLLSGLLVLNASQMNYFTFGVD